MTFFTALSTPALTIVFPNIDPVMFEAGPFAIRWYALSYVVGLLLGWWYLGKLDSKDPPVFTQKAFDDIVVWAIIGILLGGRLGYVLFYNAEYYAANPSEIMAVWKGGMSFHGGLLGVIFSMYLMCRWHKLEFFKVMDLLACVTPIGLFLGRVANFINAELYGRITDVPWAIVFPGDPFARHPSQLYEALLEGIVLFILLAWLVRKPSIRNRTGLLSGIFLFGYAIARWIGETFREPDAHIGFLASGITMGQMLCVPMLIFGVYLMWRAKKQPV